VLPWLALIATDLSFVVGFPIGYGIHYASCAPLSIWCIFPWPQACPSVCGNPWSQIPDALLAGAIFGLLPGAVAGALVHVLTRPSLHVAAVRLRLLSNLTVLGSISLGAFLMSGIFPRFGGITLAATLLPGLGIFLVASMILARRSPRTNPRQ